MISVAKGCNDPLVVINLVDRITEFCIQLALAKKPLIITFAKGLCNTSKIMTFICINSHDLASFFKSTKKPQKKPPTNKTWSTKVQ